MRLWAKITLTLTINLLAVAALATLLIQQQTQAGLESFLFAPVRERVRELGRQLEEEFPHLSDSELGAWLAEKKREHGATFAVFDDTGALVAGPQLRMPVTVERELHRKRPREAEQGDRPRRKRRGRENPPLFMVREEGYWLGYHFPVEKTPGHPPMRYTLTVTTSSLLNTPFFFDWGPWLLVSCLAAFVTILCWVPLIRRFSRSLQAMQVASNAIAEGRFEVKIPVRGSDEFAELATSVRRMASQLSQLVYGQQRFLADVAHELCAPLSRIQLSTGILEQNALPGQKTAVERLERDVAHMSALVGDLLSFTKGTVRQPELLPLRLQEIVDQVIEQERTPEAEIASNVAADLIVLADREYLARAISNVVRNAIRYAGKAGTIWIRAQQVGDRIQLVVQDCGPGLPEADLQAIFEPFYRPDPARTPGIGGAGLGLAIVKSCMEACQGSAWCRNRQPSGLEVIMELQPAPKVSA